MNNTRNRSASSERHRCMYVTTTEALAMRGTQIRVFSFVNGGTRNVASVKSSSNLMNAVREGSANRFMHLNRVSRKRALLQRGFACSALIKIGPWTDLKFLSRYHRGRMRHELTFGSWNETRLTKFRLVNRINTPLAKQFRGSWASWKRRVHLYLVPLPLVSGNRFRFIKSAEGTCAYLHAGIFVGEAQYWCSRFDRESGETKREPLHLLGYCGEKLLLLVNFWPESAPI